MDAILDLFLALAVGQIRRLSPAERRTLLAALPVPLVLFSALVAHIAGRAGWPLAWAIGAGVLLASGYGFVWKGCQVLEREVPNGRPGGSGR